MNDPYSSDLYHAMKNDFDDDILIPYLQSLLRMQIAAAENYVYNVKSESESDDDDVCTESNDTPVNNCVDMNYSILDIYSQYVRSERKTKKKN